MTVVKTKTFKSGNSEAIRLPKEVAYGPDTELVVVRSGDVLTIYPVRRSFQDMLERLKALPKPETPETREGIDWPDRPGL